jgi:hypothetical protein
MYIYNQLNRHFKKGITRVTGFSWGILLAKGDHLDRVHSDQKVHKVIRRGRLVLVIGDQESQS